MKKWFELEYIYVYDEFPNKYIESDEDEDSGSICYILFGDKGSNLGFWSWLLIILSCVTKVELDMPVVTAHISYMYWGLCIGMRHGKREESCGEIGEREDCSSGELEDSGHVYSRGWGQQCTPALATRGAQPCAPTVAKWRWFLCIWNMEKWRCFLSFNIQCEDGMLNKARHESWLGQDIGGWASIAATKPASRRHISKLLLLQRRLRILVVSHSVSLYIDFKIEELY